MDLYIGTKQIRAKPMTRGEYNVYRGWKLPSDEDGDDEGCLVEYLDSPNSNHSDHENYISWSPKAVFESAYVHIKDKQDLNSPVSTLLRFFEYEHLPEKLKQISIPYCLLAHLMASSLPNSPEATFALRKLLESKDCAVRAAL
jgi:hypothetical protein